MNRKHLFIPAFAMAIAGLGVIPAHGAAIISEDFSAPLSAAWTTTTAGGATAVVSGGNLTSTIVGGASGAAGQKAYVSTTYDNSASNYAHFETRFTMDVSHYVYTTGVYPTGTVMTPIFSQSAGGNNPLASLSLGPNEWNQKWQWRFGNGIEWGGGTTQPGSNTQVQTNADWTPNGSPAGTAPVTTLLADFVTDITYNGGQNWTIASSVTLRNAADNSVYLQMNRTTTGDAGNDISGYDPLTKTHTFNLGVIGLENNTAQPGSLQGSLGFDNFTVTAGAVPEPASLGLLALGGLALLRRRR